MAEKKLILTNPILIDGKEVKELTYAPEDITCDQFDEIDNLVSKGRDPRAMVMAENDSKRHRYIAMAAIVAANPKIDISDLMRIKGIRDMEQLRIDGRTFMFSSLEETSEESSSEEQSETTQKPTARA